jgi:hypothetical protein
MQRLQGVVTGKEKESRMALFFFAKPQAV